MNKNRFEAFSDGVLAIIITIMVLDFKVPLGHDFNSLLPILPVFLNYALSFIYIGIYWNNHHHMLHTVKSVDGATMWANLHLLFWLSLVPFVTSWMGKNHSATEPTVAYGFVLLMAGVAYWILLQTLIIHEGQDSALAKVVGKDLKGRKSVIIYALAITLAFINTWISDALFVAVAIIWLVPDRRMEKVIEIRKK